MKLYCGSCCKYSHLNCSGLRKSDYLHNSCDNYTCISYSVENVPFNYIEDSCLTMYNFFNDFPLFRHFAPNTQQSSILCNQSLLHNDDADSDCNLFYQLHTSCNYYLLSDVLNVCEVGIENQPFILHVNVRSLDKKLNLLSILIKSLNVNVDIIAVSETCETVSNSNYIYHPGI